MDDPDEPSRGWLPRIPLHFKVMVSYLVVVGLVFLPTILYLRTLFQDDLRTAVTRELQQEATTVAARLERVRPEDLEPVVRLILEAMPSRVTIIDPSGEVIGDSVLGKGQGDDHSNRPEVIEALDKGTGTSIRFSKTTRDERIYVARRFPQVGPAKGVVRLSVPTAEVLGAFERGYQFINRAGAVGLSAAVLLSLVAAFVVSRPLRRIAESARAFAAGDFGFPIPVNSNDELGEAAQALRELAARLRGTLITSGADRATLAALLDDLPCGLVLYDGRGMPSTINGLARSLCDLSPHDEHEKLRGLVLDPEVRAVIERTHAERRSHEQLGYRPPWMKSGHELNLRWLSLYGEDGAPQTGLIVTSANHESKRGALTKTLERCIRIMRNAAGEIEDVDLGAELERTASEAEKAIEIDPVRAEQVEALQTIELCRRATDELKAQLVRANVAVEFVVAHPEIHLVEADGRSRRALRRLLEVALAESSPGTTIRLHGESSPKQVTFSLHCAGAKKLKVPGIAPLVHGLGGDVGTKSEGDGVELWLKLPRA